MFARLRGLRRAEVGTLRYLRGLWLRSRWEIIGIAGLMVLLLGWSGFDEYFHRQGEPRSTLGSLYRSLCLFAIEGGDVVGDVPVRLQAARFLAPLVVFAAAVGAAMAVLHSEVQRFVAHWIVRDHVIVVGLGGRGLQLARQLVESGHRCAIVDVVDTAAESTSARLLGIPVVVTSGEADADLVEADQLADVLQRAGASRAEAIIVMTGSPPLDARFAHVLYDLQERGEAPLQAFVEMDDVDGLRNVMGYQVEVGGGALEWFSLTDRAARSLLDRLEDLLAVRDDGVDRHLVVVGATAIGRSLIVQAARNWSRDLSRRNGERRGVARLVLTLVEPAAGSEDELRRAAGDEVRRLRGRDPRVPSPKSHVGELHVTMCDLARTSFVDVLVAPPSAVIVTAEDDRELLRRSTEVTACLPRSVPVWLCTERSGGIVDIVTGPHGDVAGGRKVEVFHVLDTVLREDEIRRGTDEELARAVHQAHCRYRMGAAVRRDDLETVRPWDDLSMEVRTLNYAAVRAWRQVLAAHKYHLTPYATLGAETVRLPPDVVEELAIATHESWSAEKQRQGFRRGRRKNTERSTGPLTHPDVGLPFRELSTDGQEWNRLQARLVPEHLAAAGLQLHPLPTGSDGTGDDAWGNGAAVVRMSSDEIESLAAALHELYRDHARPDGDRRGAAALTWGDLSESQRESNRATARALPLQLGRLGYTLQPASGAAHAATHLTTDEVQTMAEAEHERWARAKRAEGYVYGPAKHEEGRPPTHPDLVSWDELDEVARDKDRVRFAAAPRLLADIGYEIVRVRTRSVR
ncbi:MAG TPA: RyR domain-containing protein [Acidimicrobiales bacterium]|nr:RyR domain-containing protein [Acidimicrobiales bacterium]